MRMTCCWGTGVTPYTTICGGWTTGWPGSQLRSMAGSHRGPRCGSHGPTRPSPTRGAEVASSVTTKLVPESVSTDVVSSRVPPLEAMLMAWDCQAESSIGPLTPLIVADALVNVTVPKLARCRDVVPHGRGLDDPLGGAPIGGGALRLGRAP